MASCVSEDAVVSFNDGALVIEGVDHLRTYMANQFATTGTLGPDTRGTHAMCNSIVRIDGDTATAETSGVTYRSEEHTSELQSLMRISYAVFCLKKKKQMTSPHYHYLNT